MCVKYDILMEFVSQFIFLKYDNTLSLFKLNLKTSKALCTFESCVNVFYT